MRVPGGIDGTDNVYSVAWAAFPAIYRNNCCCDRKISTVAFPAFRAGFGGVPFNEVARQMSVAYRHYLHPPHRLDWHWVTGRQRAITYDGSRKALLKTEHIVWFANAKCFYCVRTL